MRHRRQQAAGNTLQLSWLLHALSPLGNHAGFPCRVPKDPITVRHLLLARLSCVKLLAVDPKLLPRVKLLRLLRAQLKPPDALLTTLVACARLRCGPREVLPAGRVGPGCKQAPIEECKRGGAERGVLCSGLTSGCMDTGRMPYLCRLPQ